MSEFYGGPNAKDQNGKHYTSVIEKILKNQAKSNNSEFTVLNVQTKSGGKDVFIVKNHQTPVSYTHLTLPTILRV